MKRPKKKKKLGSRKGKILKTNKKEQPIFLSQQIMNPKKKICVLKEALFFFLSFNL